jgi:uncharacterized membrane protein YedE/YeeE
VRVPGWLARDGALERWVGTNYWRWGFWIALAAGLVVTVADVVSGERAFLALAGGGFVFIGALALWALMRFWQRARGRGPWD